MANDKKIVLIEDDEAIRDVLVIILQGVNFRVMSYISAEEFLTSQELKADLFLIDYRLPGMNGIELCKKLRTDSQTSDIPVILLSADFYIRKKMKDCGAQAALDKPFSRLELLELVTTALQA